MNPPPMKTQNHSTWCWNEQMWKHFDWVHHQNTPEEKSYQIDAHLIFTMREQPIYHVAYK